MGQTYPRDALLFGQTQCVSQLRISVCSRTWPALWQPTMKNNLSMSKRHPSSPSFKELPTSPQREDFSTIVAALNRTVHEPARLAILIVLSACQAADFVFLRTATGLSAGNLSVQLTRLQQAQQKPQDISHLHLREVT